MLELKSVYPLLPPCSAGGQESEGHWQAAMSERSVPLGVVFSIFISTSYLPTAWNSFRPHLHDRVNQRVKCSRDWSQWVAGKAALLGQKRDGADAVLATPCTNGLHEDTRIRAGTRTLWRVSHVCPASEWVFRALTSQMFPARLWVWVGSTSPCRHHFADKGPYSQSFGFPAVMYRFESWTVKKVEHRRTDAFKLWFWRRSWESLGLQGNQISQS